MPAAAPPGPPDQVCTASEFGQYVAYLTAHGVTGTALAAAIGNAAGGRTHRQIEQQLTGWLKTRPKGP